MAREPVLPTPRAAMFAAACLALGAGAHRVMSVAPIPAWALVVGGLGAYLPARYATGRGERGLLGIAALMGGLQVALHVLFCYAQHGAAIAASAASTVKPMPGMPAGMSMPSGMAMPAVGASASAASCHASAGMLVGHAVAALLCAWWLRQGEASLHALIRSVVVQLRAMWTLAAFTVPPADRTSRTARVASRPCAWRTQWQRGVAAQRGPPRTPAYL